LKLESLGFIRGQSLNLISRSLWNKIAGVLLVFGDNVLVYHRWIGVGLDEQPQVSFDFAQDDNLVLGLFGAEGLHGFDSCGSAAG
jgi:hypothetical protein